LLFPPLQAEAINREFGEIVIEARAALSPETLRSQEEAMEVAQEPETVASRLREFFAAV